MAYLTQMKNKQQGVVLITALIMVIAVTGIAVTLMSSSSIDIKITNAAQEREVAENQLIGEVQRIIADEVSKGAGNQFFLTPEEVSDKGIVMAERDDMQSRMINLNKGVLDLECPRRFSFTAGISCNMVQVSTTIEYGSKSKHQLTIVTGVAQEMASLSKGI
ncbi:pilus assembly protein PilX [Pseudoalteromonas sp. SCSIO 43095]|uniref:pilus assembly protein PilX n=1 Tax=Pseudoalteromonas TaxID=53246 RepID=UPI001BDEC2E3|nr:MULTISPECIES: pilus assembly protein PilX [Pseudoalteromonas]MBT2150398.1 pilus assembly protein PilX [Pseudoalteromonas tetraodonis]MDX1728785.1 pilus assembly protein PilX [Pseudoalteromonas tetraodonis]URQ97834.1 pilus assembly protein PilX [Pseudoalteromonas sp. SCSIO 43095]